MDFDCDEEEIAPKLRGQYSAKYTRDQLREAIENIRNNTMSYGAASKMYNVPKATLHNKMRNPVNCRKGATTILSKDQEGELAEWILLHADFGDPRTKQDIVTAAAEIAQLDAGSSGNFKNGIPSSGWVDGFLKRHPLCRYRTPQGISKASSINTKDDFAGLWRNIYSYFKKTNQLDLLNKPDNWWNADETCFEKDKIPKKVIARRGAKRVSRREMGPPKANTTVTYAFSGAGDYVEPLITLKDSNSSVAEIAFALGSVGANYGINQTESGWTRKESFYYFVSMHLHNQWEAKNVPKPRILTIDGYGAHFSPKLFRWCRLNGVIIIVLYPGATPFMQMCDTTMFSPMKQKHTQLYSQWRLKNPTKTMNDVEFVKILKQINDAVIKKESIINGWRATGLQPFNFNNLNTDGLLTASNCVYDFKGDLIDPPKSNSIENVSQPKINVLSNVLLDESSEVYMGQNELVNKIYLNETSGADISSSGFKRENNNIINSPMEIDIPRDVDLSSEKQSDNSLRVIELIDVDLDEIPEGPLCPEHDSIQLASLNALERPQHHSSNPPEHSSELVDLSAMTNDQVRVNNCVKFGELAGVFRSQYETNFDLSSFGMTSSTDSSNKESASKLGKYVDKIRRDVKQLGLLCAAGDKEKLINILVINQQLDIIDPPMVESIELESPQEHRSIKSILKPPTMPQRVKPKRNTNLKVSYGVVTAKEVVQSLLDREAADRQHDVEREEDEIAKIARENEMTSVDEEVKRVRKLLGVARSENAALNKETTKKKKNKSIDSSDLAFQEAAKSEREVQIKDYDEQLHVLRAKMKDLKTIHLEANKSVLLKRKTYELQKKEVGNKVRPSITPPEIDESELDTEPH